MITFSIITCTYNAERELKTTLDSVMMQDFRNVEHIIIDGASKDSTVAIAQQYKEKSDADDNGHTVIICSEPDNGLYDAMNKGIEKANGDYVCFLNAGDTLPDRDTLEMIADGVADGEDLPAVLYGDTDIVDEQGHFVRHRRLKPSEDITWRSFRQGMLICHQAFYARTDIAKCIPYDLKYRYSADVDWCIRIMKESERHHLSLRYIDAVIANFRQGGMTTVNHRASLKERFNIMCRHYGVITTLAMHVWFVIRSFFKK